jgi:hypothetical protein
MVLTPSEYKTKLLNEIEEHWNILSQYLVSDSIRVQAQINTINCYLNQWKEFKIKSIVSQIHDLEIESNMKSEYERLEPDEYINTEILICTKCGRKSTSKTLNEICNMTQPNGSKCNGYFN